MGMWRFFAGIAHKQLFVSPSTKKASGSSFSRTGSMFMMICPMVVVAFPPAAFRK